MRISYTVHFKKDYKRLAKQGKDLAELDEVIRKLAREGKLEAKYRGHKLIGRWRNHRECHIGPDWLLIYRISKDMLCLERTGSHSDLFG